MLSRVICLCLTALLACACPAWATFEEVEDKELKAQVAEALKGQLKDFRLVNLKVGEMAQGLNAGKAVIPVVDAKGELVEGGYQAARISLRAPEHKGVAVINSGKTEAPDAKEVGMPAEQIYQLGDCGSLKKGDSSAACGNLTILDGSQTMATIMNIDPSYGMTITEPLNSLLGSNKYESIHIVYNQVYHIPVDLQCDEVAATGDDASEVGFDISYIYKKTNAILQCDGQFYGVNPGTAWSRMDAIWASVQTVYSLFQVAWNEDWRLRIYVIGHQGWLPGFGPTTTNKVDLSNEVKNLRLHSPFTSNDLHHFFVGYDVSGVLGRACGIGTAGGGLGGGSNNNHQYSEARTHMTHFATFIVAAHEAGHVLGGVHGDGSASLCPFPGFCGPSIMLAGGGGAPDGRVPFFSRTNSSNMEAVIDPHLPDY
jgi:hypothetical protein